jgi:ribosomal subunit interface protein
MKLQIRERDVSVTSALRAHVQQRVGLALGRFAGRIAAVTVRISDDAGEKKCEIDVGLRPRKVRVQDIHPDPFTAVDRASDRVSSSVGRALDREREWEQAATWPRHAGGSDV